MATMLIQFFLSLSLLVVLHELGHFLPAKWFKTRVEKFFLFFDVKFALFKKKIGETVYGIGWLPLGGYVKISGMIDESMDKDQMAQPPQPWEFRSKPAWQRLIIMLGGVIVNFLLGFLIFGLLLWQNGEEYLPAENAKFGIAIDSLGYELGLRDGDQILRIGDQDFDIFNPGKLREILIVDGAKSITIRRDGQETILTPAPTTIQKLSSYEYKNYSIFSTAIPTEVKELVKGSNAEKGGLLPEDIIQKVNSDPTPYFHQFSRKLGQLSGQEIVLDINRKGETRKLNVQVDEDGKIGFYPKPPNEFFDFETKTYSLGQALPKGVTKGVNFLVLQIKSFGKMFSGKIKAKDSLGGFGTISSLFPKTWDWTQFWNITAILSLILGFMNLLPIPGLDGGHVMFLLWEVATGKKPSDKFLERATTIGFILLIALVLYANGLDLLRWLGR